MKMIIVALAFVATAAAAAVDYKPVDYKPVGDYKPVDYKVVEILRSSFDQQPQGGYTFDFENADGTKRQEQGELKTVQNEENKPQDVIVVRGSYTYINEFGQPETVEYFADENGYVANGNSIPKLPSRR